MSRHRLALLLSVVGFLLAIVGGAVAVSSYTAAESERRLYVVAEDIKRDVSERFPEELAQLAQRVESHGPVAQFWVPIRDVAEDVDDLTYVEIYAGEATFPSFTLRTVGSLIEVKDLSTWERRIGDDLLEREALTALKAFLTEGARSEQVHLVWFEPDDRGIRLHTKGSVRGHEGKSLFFHASAPFRAPAGVSVSARCDVVEGSIVEGDLPLHAAAGAIEGSTEAWPRLEFLRPPQLGIGLPSAETSPRLVVRIPPVGPPAGVVTLWTLAISMSLLALVLFVVRGARA